MDLKLYTKGFVTLTGLVAVGVFIYTGTYIYPVAITKRLAISSTIWKLVDHSSHSLVVKPTYVVTWYRPPTWSRFYRETFNTSFDQCEYSNCNLTIGRNHALKADAVIFDGRWLRKDDFFSRRPGQVWIFEADEAPRTYYYNGGHWSRGGWISSFNWTMTYDRSNTDIYEPVGEIVGNPEPVVKDYTRIFDKKNKTALIIYSNCHTMSERGKYLSILKKYVDIDSLGACGKPWHCGQRNRHDDCFDIVNNYKFYLAFENAICDQYFTEKLFGNYNYDTIMVVRGGRGNDTKRTLPAGTYISTGDFKSIKQLAAYMNKVSKSETLYTEILKRKNKYYSVPRKMVYQRALCNICERLNNQDKYRQNISDIRKWAFDRKPCQNATDLNE